MLDSGHFTPHKWDHDVSVNLMQVCVGFANEYPVVFDSEAVYDLCEPISQRFAHRARAWNPLILGGGQVDGNVFLRGHFAVQIDNLVFDWTRRQFYPYAPVPYVTTPAAWRQEWPALPTATPLED